MVKWVDGRKDHIFSDPGEGFPAVVAEISLVDIGGSSTEGWGSFAFFSLDLVAEIIYAPVNEHSSGKLAIFEDVFLIEHGGFPLLR